MRNSHRLGAAGLVLAIALFFALRAGRAPGDKPVSAPAGARTAALTPGAKAPGPAAGKSAPVPAAVPTRLMGLRAGQASAQAAPPPAPGFEPSWERFFRSIPSAEVLATYDSDPDGQGVSSHQELIRAANLKYPIFNLRERWQLDPGTGERKLLGRDAMVADHVMVTVAQGASGHEVSSFLAQNGLSVLREMPQSGIIVLSFEASDPRSVERALALLRSRPELFERSSPDYIAFNY